MPAETQIPEISVIYAMQLMTSITGHLMQVKTQDFNTAHNYIRDENVLKMRNNKKINKCGMIQIPTMGKNNHSYS